MYYDNVGLSLERILSSFAVAGADGREQWCQVMRPWVKWKLRLPALLGASLNYDGPLLQCAHHMSHAASAFYPSPFERAAILTVDGVGE